MDFAKKVLTDEQRAAVDSFDKPTALLAGAGSGKTSVLVERYLKCLQAGASPFQILTVTFTVDAAEELRTRIEKAIASGDFSQTRRKVLEREIASTPFLGTLHAFCFRVVDQWGTELGLPRMAEVLSSFHFSESFDIQYSLWQEGLEETTLQRLLGFFSHRNLREFAFSYYTKRHHFEDRVTTDDPDLKWVVGQLLGFWKRLESDFHTRGIFGFDDLEYFALKLLRELPKVRDYYAERLHFFFVDEFQDTSPDQWEIIQLVSQKRPEGLFIVGDPKQSIYRFRNADYRVFFKACEAIASHGGQTLQLSTNFRSEASLLEKINLFSEKLFTETPIPFAPMLAGLPRAVAARPLEVVRYPGVRNELTESERVSCLSYVKSLLKEGVRPKDIAILFRVSDRIVDYFDLFLNEDIPAVAKTVQAIFQNYDTVDLSAFLYCVADPLDDFRLAAFLRGRFMNWPLARLEQCQRHEGKTLFEKVRGEHDLQWLVKLLDSGDVMVERVLYALFESTEYFPKSQATMMEWLTPLVSEPHTVWEAIDKIESWKRNGIRSTMAAGGTSRDAISLLTVHGAKGLEYDHVLLLDNLRTPPRSFPTFLCHDRRFGLRLEKQGEPWEAQDYKKLLEWNQREEYDESRRILYVAMTRAKKRLSLFLPENPDLIPKGTWGEYFQSML